MTNISEASATFMAEGDSNLNALLDFTELSRGVKVLNVHDFAGANFSRVNDPHSHIYSRSTIWDREPDCVFPHPLRQLRATH